MQSQDCLVTCTHCIGRTELQELPARFEMMPGQTKEFREAIRRLINRIRR